MRTALQLLVTAVLLPFAAVLHAEDLTPRVEILVQASESWDGTALPAFPRGTPQISIVRITVPPHVRMAMHKHPFINAGVLLSGELIVETAAGATRRVLAGEALVEVTDQWHFGRNEGEEPAEIIVFYAGEVGGVLSIEQ